MKNIYQKLSQARVEIQNMNLKKSGHNKYSNYTYYELPDFLPAINAVCEKLGMFTQFNINAKGGVAVLKIINTENVEEIVTFTSETAEVEIGKKADGSGGADPIQNLGGKITYMRRYLYMTAFEIAESDIVEKVKRETAEDVAEKDKKAISEAKDFKTLTEVCSNLKTKYKVELIKPLYDKRKEELDDKVVKGDSK